MTIFTMGFGKTRLFLGCYCLERPGIAALPLFRRTISKSLKGMATPLRVVKQSRFRLCEYFSQIRESLFVRYRCRDSAS
jgi:hypothetical protein